MPTPVLICDDSSFARKQLARVLPPDWDAAIGFAAGGAEALAAVRAGKADILFLDLNMPGMDGYQVLEAIRAEDLSTLVIVVSGDVQPQARERVQRLGALAFVKKPVREGEIARLLRDYGIHHAVGARPAPPPAETGFDVRDSYREIANVAMGQAADMLARYLGAFVAMPVPHVNLLDGAELGMALGALAADESPAAVSQGFIGGGIAGEALMTFREASASDMAELLRYEGAIDEAARLELLADVATIVIGACLKGLSEQLDLAFSQSHPVMLGRQLALGGSLKRAGDACRRTLAIELACAIEDRRIHGELLLLISEDSLATLDRRIACLVD